MKVINQLHVPADLSIGKYPLYPLNKMLVRLLDTLKKRKIICPLPGLERILGLLARSQVTIPTELSQLHGYFENLELCSSGRCSFVGKSP